MKRDDTMYTIDTYAVIGHPVSHSKSPFIHQQFAKQTQQALQYLAIDAEPNKFFGKVEEFKKHGGKGLNVTVPFKQQAWELADHNSERAKIAQAVNTLVFKDNKIWGDNTDGIGLLRDITINQNYSLHNKKILILGAGGAVRGILQPLLLEKPSVITIANRTRSKALELASAFSNLGETLGCDYIELEGKFDLIINATSAGLKGEQLALPNNLLAQNAWCYDLTYGNSIPFLQWAQAQGASRCINGLGMLIEQAAESFYLWRGIRPETKSVIEILREKR